jgi:hypothetical protein
MADCGQELHPAWQLLLQQQPQLRQQQQSACTLLSVSKGMSACLHSVAAGQLHCEVIPRSDSGCNVRRGVDCVAWLLSLQSFQRWLAKHGRLLQHLDLEVEAEGHEATEIAEALQQAKSAAAFCPDALQHTADTFIKAGAAPANSSSSSSNSSHVDLPLQCASEDPSSPQSCSSCQPAA